ncbi:MAG: tetratricopeptide repeat protein [Bdellovibrionaceae bacterium]|nr:tetratricopeptide repeat protein [Pseudobdellovibrionaceae bacterium]
MKAFTALAISSLFALGFGSGYAVNESQFARNCEDSARETYFQQSFDDLAAEKTDVALQDLEPVFHCENLSGQEEMHRSALFFALGHYAPAEKYVLRAIQMNPYDAEAFGLRGQIYFQQGRYEKALRSLNRSIELSPSSEIEQARVAARAQLDPRWIPETRGPASTKKSD